MAFIPAAAVPKITCRDLRLLQLNRTSGLVLVDVRAPGDFAGGHVQGAINAGASAVLGAGLPRTGQLVVYCSEASCPLSAGAADKLIKAGYGNVALLDGGLAEWIRLNYPVQSGSGAPRGHNHARRPRTGLREARDRVSARSVLVLDVRPEREFKAGRVPKARNVPLEGLDAALAGLPRDRDVLVYDRRPARSKQAMDKLAAAGFKVSELSGGWGGWVKRKHPVEVK